MSLSPESLPVEFASDLAALPNLVDTEEWIANRHKFPDKNHVTEYISWVNEDVSQEVLDTVDYKDRLAEIEALKTGKLGHYERGRFNPSMLWLPIRNWCVWEEEQDAIAAVHRPDHRGASTYALDHNVYRFVVVRGSRIARIGDPVLPDRLEQTRFMTLPQLLAHRALKESKAS